MIVEARVIKSFKHTNTGLIWFDGDTFRGSAADAEQLAGRGYLELTGATPAGSRRRGADVPALAAMTVRELAAMCAERGIDVPAKARKADLVALLESEG